MFASVNMLSPSADYCGGKITITSMLAQVKRFCYLCRLLAVAHVPSHGHKTLSTVTVPRDMRDFYLYVAT